MKRRIGEWFLKLAGWKDEGAAPIEKRYVLIAAPHTSGWDLPFMLAFSFIYGVKINWMGKHPLFRPPHGWLMRKLGGIPIVRHRRENRVAQMARAFQENEELVLVVPPEGTRRYVAHWKSGFYHIALAAKVPIVLGFLDYGRRRGGFGPAFYPTGDVSRDMEEIRDFYADKIGKYPDLFGEVRLKEEM